MVIYESVSPLRADNKIYGNRKRITFLLGKVFSNSDKN
jgi:hypothetical protein